MIYESFCAEDTLNLGRSLGETAKPNDIYCLTGDLGTGKTVFTKGFAEGLGITDRITSPTFTIVNEYTGRIKLFHFDVYRISTPDELFDIGFDEYITGGGVCLIEWAELIKPDLPDGCIWITIEKDLNKGLDYRKITVEGGNSL